MLWGLQMWKCPLGTKNYSLKEEKELQLIERNLHFNNLEHRWMTPYPWIRDPADLPDNRKAAFGMLLSTEKRLAKNTDHARVYQEQIQDMIDRGVARKLTKSELEAYDGPIHYVSHHEVVRPDSKSTPVRIVFNTSAKYMGHALNEYWAKGPDLLNSLLGVLIRFRENEVALIGDIKKMYHSVGTTQLEQHTHRFLWRDMDARKEPDTYVIQRVSFGDRPSGTIATVALRKTAEMAQEKYPQEAKIIRDNTYMDVIIESVGDRETAESITRNIEKLVDVGGFKIKGWTISGSSNGPIRYDPDRLASLRFNPLLSEAYKKFSLCSHHDPDANFFTELVDCEYYTEENFNEMLHQKNILEVNNCLSLLHLNIRSLHRNLDSLTTLLKNLELRFSFIGITETWLRDSSHHTDISGYNLVHNPRKYRTGGGVGLYLANNFDF